jgi:hypothetical protein
MKNLHLLPLTAVLALLFMAAPALADEKPPALPIDQALKIAQDYLQKHGATCAIVGLTVERPTLHSSYWYAKWSSPVTDGERKESGLRIDMDGTIARIVSAPHGGYEPPVGQRPVGARNMR